MSHYHPVDYECRMPFFLFNLPKESERLKLRAWTAQSFTEVREGELKNEEKET